MGLTFGELVERGGVREHVSRVTRDVIQRSNQQAAEDARVHLQVITCDACTAASCCSAITTAFLAEAIPIAARLIREGRDTPALRAQLRRTADAMEASSLFEYETPCVFLDAARRCSIYDDRPSACGTHLVSSPAELCAKPDAEVMAYHAPLQDTVPGEHAAALIVTLGLEHIGTQYFGVMPRMVWMCLEAWPRRDYVRFLARHGRAAATAVLALAPPDE